MINDTQLYVLLNSSQFRSNVVPLHILLPRQQCPSDILPRTIALSGAILMGMHSRTILNTCAMGADQESKF
jgi:hypothetical protein